MDMSKYDISFDPGGVIELENLILEGNVFLWRKVINREHTSPMSESLIKTIPSAWK